MDNLKPPKKSSDKSQAWVLAGLVGEIGLTLALPLVILVPLAVKLDRAMHTVPLFIIAGMSLSLLISSLVIFRRLKTIL